MHYFHSSRAGVQPIVAGDYDILRPARRVIGQRSTGGDCARRALKHFASCHRSGLLPASQDSRTTNSLAVARSAGFLFPLGASSSGLCAPFSYTISVPMIQQISPARSVSGAIQLPGDKSISHRYAMLAAIAEGAIEDTQLFDAARIASRRSPACGRWESALRTNDGETLISGTGWTGSARLRTCWTRAIPGPPSACSRGFSPRSRS